MSDIRVSYSGLIAFIVGLIGVSTGLVFTLIVTRRLSPEEFGTWSLIGYMISYFLISEAIIDFWTLRQVSRGENVGRTSLFSSLIFSFGIIPFYLILAHLISGESNADLNLLIFGAVLVPVYFVNQALTNINTGFKPQNTSYSLLILEVVKIPAALSFVFFLDLGVVGVIIAILIAYVIAISFQIQFAKSKLKNKFNFSYLKRWLRLSWVSLYSAFPRLISSLDILLYTFITGSVIGVAFYSASLAIANLVAHSGLITQALYPKLLAKGSHEHINENFSLLMYFGIPLLGIAIIFSKPALFALNPAYVEGSLIVIILAFKTFFFILFQTFQKVLIGIEEVDVEKNPKFRDLKRSKLFSVSTIRYIKSSIYIGLMITVVKLLHSSNFSELDLVIYWTLIALLIEIPFFVYLWILVKRDVSFSFPYANTAKYLGATLAFIVIFFITSDFIITYQESIYNFLPELILQLAICIGIYLSLTYFIDNKTKILFKSIISEIFSKE